MQLGETWYVVSKDWWTRWRKGCTGEIDKDGPLAEKDVGPVNNAGILSSVAKLQVGLIEGIDVEYVPAEVWNALQSWCVAVPFAYCLCLKQRAGTGHL